MSDDRRDNRSILGAINASEDRILDQMDRRFKAVEERMGESHAERRQTEDRIWQVLDDHYGRKVTSHHSVLEKDLGDRITKNSDMTKKIHTIYGTISVITFILYSFLLFFGRWFRDRIYGAAP
jgi:hypothetical protein